MTPSEQIWEDIKDKDIDVFAFKSKVHKFCEYMDIDEKKCYVVCKASAALPALEVTLGNEYTCTLVEKYVVIEKVGS